MENTEGTSPVTILPVFPGNEARERGDPALTSLEGATILRIGTPLGMKLEGGGLALEYLPAGATEPRLMLFEFNELGLWLSAHGPD